MNELKVDSSQKSCWPSSCLETPVRWIREHPTITILITLVLAAAIGQVGYISAIPETTRWIVIGSSVGVIGLIAIAIIFEWRRQVANENQIELKCQNEFDARFVKFLKDNESEIKAHRDLIIGAIGGQEAFDKLPSIEVPDIERRASDLRIKPDEMSPSSSIRKGVVEKTILGETFIFDFLVIRFRPKKVDLPKEMIGETPEGSVRIITLYPRKLCQKIDDNRWLVVGYYGTGYLFDKYFDPRFQNVLESPHYNMTDQNKTKDRPTLTVINELVTGTHPYYELC